MARSYVHEARRRIGPKRARIRLIIERLAEEHPDATIALRFRDARRAAGTGLTEGKIATQHGDVHARERVRDRHQHGGAVIRAGTVRQHERVG